MYSVMVVDDEKAIRENLARLVPFEEEGFLLCATAVNGEDALQKLKLYAPDLILLDVSMPVLDGIGFLKEMKRGEYQNAEVVILSGYSEFEYARAAMRYGVKAYLTKPVDEDEAVGILREVKAALDARKKRMSQEALKAGVMALRSLYQGKAGSCEKPGVFFLLHCVMLPDDAQEREKSSRALGELLREELPEAESGFYRLKGSVYTYLLPDYLLEEYQGSLSLFCRHLLYALKKRNIAAAVLADASPFEGAQGAFRQEFDRRLYGMLTELFYGGGDCIIYEKDAAGDGEAERLCCEEAFLDGLKKGLAELQREETEKWMEVLFGEIGEKRLRLEYLQEIHYRIYYLLLGLIREPEAEEQEEQRLEPADFRRQERFAGFEAWKAQQEGQIRYVYELLEKRRKNGELGVVGEVLLYVQQHYREPVTIRQVADLFYVNAAYLGRAFQKAAGVGFKQYVNELRIAEAKRLLRQSDRMIYEIAQEVGFTESKYFIAKFTEAVGESPSEYRKKGGSRA